MINTGKGTYLDPRQDYEPVAFPQIQPSTYVAKDGEVLETEFKMPFANSPTLARRLAKIAIERERYGISANVTLNYSAAAVDVGDRITISNDRVGWDERVFRVEEADLTVQTGVRLRIREDGPQVWSWVQGEALEVTPPPALNLPNFGTILAPLNFTVTESLYTTNTRSDFKVRINLSWDSASSAGRLYDIQFRRFGDTEWVDDATNVQGNEWFIADFELGQFEFRIRAKAVVGNSLVSPWVVRQLNVLGKTAPPNRPNNLFVQDGILSWTYAEDLDFAGFKVRLHEGNKRTWVDALPLHAGLVSDTRFDIRNYVGGVKTFLVRTVDLSGNLSERATIVVGLGDPTVNNVILETCYEDDDWPGDISGGVINGSNQLASSESGVFWAGPSVAFWNGTDTGLFWQITYQPMVYDFVYRPPDDATPSQMTVDLISSVQNVEILYQPPDNGIFWGDGEDFFYGAANDDFWDLSDEYYAWPGSISSTPVIYRFRVIVPGLSYSTPPTISSICVRLDVDDIAEALEDFVVTGGQARLPIQLSYRRIKVVNMTIQDTGTGARTLEILDKDTVLGPLVESLDSAGNQTESVIDARIQGF